MSLLGTASETTIDYRARQLLTRIVQTYDRCAAENRQRMLNQPLTPESMAAHRVAYENHFKTAQWMRGLAKEEGIEIQQLETT